MSFSKENRGFSAMEFTVFRSKYFSLGTNVGFFLKFLLLEANIVLLRKLWIFCCYDFWKSMRERCVNCYF